MTDAEVAAGVATLSALADEKVSPFFRGRITPEVLDAATRAVIAAVDKVRSNAPAAKP